MKYFKCPHCGEKTISIVRKAFLDVRYGYKCKKCNGAYGVPRLAGISLAFATMSAFYYVFTTIQDITIKVFLFILIAFLDVFINIVFMPIIKE